MMMYKTYMVKKRSAGDTCKPIKVINDNFYHGVFFAINDLKT